jgi:alpha-maltose-1-phosphate synthase
MILISHPTGNECVREATRALNEAGMLSEFWTSVRWSQGFSLNRVLPAYLSRELCRRSFPDIGQDQVRCYPWIEVGRLASNALGLSGMMSPETGKFSIDAVYRRLDSRVSRRLYETPNIRGLYAYEDGALASFRAARQVGVKTIYELPIGYWKYYQELTKEEARLQPEFAAALHGMADSEEKLRRKDEEIALASEIVVPSEFVRETLRKAGPLKARVTVLPYGAPSCHPPGRAQKTTGNEKLKVLFVGGLSQRKGVSYLFQAVARLGSQVELTLIGRRVADCPAIDAALRRYSWIPSLSHAAVLREMSRHDVMVFPSLFEGCALVVMEAMSQGVPVITTPNSGALHSIRDGINGFIVPIRDADAIVERLEMLILDRKRLIAMSQAAMATADQHSWEQYRHRFAGIVRRVLTNDTAVLPFAAIHSLDSKACPEC